MSVHVKINGVERELADGATVAAAVRSIALEPDGRGVAVALEGQVVPRAQWPQIVLRDGAMLELVVAVQGG